MSGNRGAKALDKVLARMVRDQGMGLRGEGFEASPKEQKSK